MATKAKTGEKVVFRALRFKNHRIVLDPKAKKEVRGQLVTTGLNNNFSRHPHGLTVEFENGFFTTDDPEVIEALKAHEDYGSMFDSTDQDVVKPTAEALIKQAQRDTAAATAGNTDPNQCPVCKDVFKNAAGVEIHMRTHKGE